MHSYVVIATDRDNRLVALGDSNGRHHVAHCRSDLPVIDVQLSGALPAVGIALLIGPDGDAYRLIFSRINCTREWALSWVRDDREASVPGQRTQSTPPLHTGAQ
jgi:hypothetical protein